MMHLLTTTTGVRIIQDVRLQQLTYGYVHIEQQLTKTWDEAFAETENLGEILDGSREADEEKNVGQEPNHEESETEKGAEKATVTTRSGREIKKSSYYLAILKLISQIEGARGR